jgi:hypothetical protein
MEAIAPCDPDGAVMEAIASESPATPSPQRSSLLTAPPCQVGLRVAKSKRVMEAIASDGGRRDVTVLERLRLGVVGIVQAPGGGVSELEQSRCVF